MKKNGFTLIELLVVIAIVGILAAMLVPLTAKGGTAAKKKRAQLEANALAVAVGQFHDDHHYMPCKKGEKQLGDDKSVQTDDAEWMEVLQGNNALKKNYLQAKTDDSGELFDPWGKAYTVWMDRNLDGRVTDDKRVAMERVVVISSGPDPDDSKDDISTADWMK